MTQNRKLTLRRWLNVIEDLETLKSCIMDFTEAGITKGQLRILMDIIKKKTREQARQEPEVEEEHQLNGEPLSEDADSSQAHPASSQESSISESQEAGSTETNAAEPQDAGLRKPQDTFEDEEEANSSQDEEGASEPNPPVKRSLLDKVLSNDRFWIRFYQTIMANGPALKNLSLQKLVAYKLR
jgi:cobalamin biosynthesis protein CobT